MITMMMIVIKKDCNNPFFPQYEDPNISSLMR